MAIAQISIAQISIAQMAIAPLVFTLKLWCRIVVLRETVVIQWKDIFSELLWLVLFISLLF
jgi:hypothetical protein